MKVALLCSGLGHVVRGHEVFARDLFELMRGAVDMTLFKGAGEEEPDERVVPCVPRTAAYLEGVHVPASPRWQAAAQEQERLRIEHETFAYAALGPLLEGAYDVVHCLEQEVCNVVYANRHLFARTPAVLFSNGGAIPSPELPQCDFVQEHTPYNLAWSARHKAFMIPHGVDVHRFRPGLTTDFRLRHCIPEHARLLISVGTICVHHKRMDHVIREVAQLGSDVYLAIVGQEHPDAPAIRALGRQLLGDRVVFDRLTHVQLPQAYAAANAFVLGSLFETFGIVYIEAMAMGLPVFCTDHPNQRLIVQEGIFVDMGKPGALAAALRDTPQERLADLARKGREIAEKQYDLNILRQQYLSRYAQIAAAAAPLPQATLKSRLIASMRNAWRGQRRWISAWGRQRP